MVALKRGGGAGVDFLDVPDAWDRAIEFKELGRRKRVYMVKGRYEIKMC